MTDRDPTEVLIVDVNLSSERKKLVNRSKLSRATLMVGRRTCNMNVEVIWIFQIRMSALLRGVRNGVETM